jgi:hypothetical protein
MIKVSQKVIADIVKGLHPVTGAPINYHSSSLQSQIMKALLSSNPSDKGQLSCLVDDMVYLSPDHQVTNFPNEVSSIGESIMCKAICDDYSVGINAHELAADYDISLSKVLAYLIDDNLLSREQAAFFTHSLQCKKSLASSEKFHSVVSLSDFKSRRNKPLTRVGA